VEVHDDHFPQNTPDAEWLRAVGKRGWVILSKDSRIKHNRVELEALLAAHVPCFCLTASDMTGPEMAAAFLVAMPTILRLIDKLPSPFIAGISRQGSVSLLYSHDAIIGQIVDIRKSAEHLEKPGR
jgi:hypothetical protein